MFENGHRLTKTPTLPATH